MTKPKTGKRTPASNVGALIDLIYEGSLAAIRKRLAEAPELIDQHKLLHRAASEGRSDVCELLLELGADINYGPSPPLADTEHHPETARRLLALGARPDGTDVAVSTPLVSAATSGDLAFAELLVEAGADIHREHLNRPLTPTGWAEYYAGVKPTAPVAKYLRGLGGINPYNEPKRPDDIWEGVRGEWQIEIVEQALQGRAHPVPFERAVGKQTLTLRQSRFGAQKFLFRCLFSVDFAAAGSACELALVLPHFWPNHAAALAKPKFSWPWELMFHLGNALAGGARLRHGDVLMRGDAIFGRVEWQEGFDQWVAVRHESFVAQRKKARDARLSETLLLVPQLGPKPLASGKASKEFADRKAKLKWNETAGKLGRNTLIVPLCYDAPWLKGRWI